MGTRYDTNEQYMVNMTNTIHMGNQNNEPITMFTQKAVAHEYKLTHAVLPSWDINIFYNTQVLGINVDFSTTLARCNGMVHWQ